LCAIVFRAASDRGIANVCAAGELADWEFRILSRSDSGTHGDGHNQKRRVAGKNSCLHNEVVFGPVDCKSPICMRHSRAHLRKGNAPRAMVMVQFESAFLNTRLVSLVNPQAGMPALRS